MRRLGLYGTGLLIVASLLVLMPNSRGQGANHSIAGGGVILCEPRSVNFSRPRGERRTKGAYVMKPSSDRGESPAQRTITDTTGMGRNRGESR